MKKFLTFGLLLATATASHAIALTFKPNDWEGDTDDLFDLEHQEAYSFGISTSSGSGDALKDYLNSGYTITSAKLTIWNIWDWKPETDILNIHLLNGTATGVRTVEENPYDNVMNDFFSPSSRSGGQVYYSNQIFLTSWTDPVGGVNNGFDFNYSFTTAQLATLSSYVTDGGTFGLGFDPDCHYFNTGVEWCIEVSKPPVNVPDRGSTAALLGLALLGLGGARFALAKAKATALPQAPTFPAAS